MGILPKSLVDVIIFLLIGVIVVFIFKQGIKILNVIIMILLLIFVWFTFFTEKGSVRFAIATSGHPVIAYKTTISEDTSKKIKNESYYTLSNNILVDGKAVKYIKCETKWIVRISSIVE